MKQALKYFMVGFILCFLTFFVPVSIFMSYKLGLLIGSISGCIFGLFCIGFMLRPLEQIEFEIHSGNKKPDFPMSWYEERVRVQIRDMGFTLEKKVGGREYYLPRALQRVYELNLELEVSPYMIHVKASRLMIRLIATYVEIDEVDEVDGIV